MTTTLYLIGDHSCCGEHSDVIMATTDKALAEQKLGEIRDAVWESNREKITMWDIPLSTEGNLAIELTYGLERVVSILEGGKVVARQDA